MKVFQRSLNNIHTPSMDSLNRIPYLLVLCVHTHRQTHIIWMSENEYPICDMQNATKLAFHIFSKATKKWYREKRRRGTRACEVQRIWCHCGTITICCWPPLMDKHLLPRFWGKQNVERCYNSERFTCNCIRICSSILIYCRNDKQMIWYSIHKIHDKTTKKSRRWWWWCWIEHQHRGRCKKCENWEKRGTVFNNHNEKKKRKKKTTTKKRKPFVVPLLPCIISVEIVLLKFPLMMLINFCFSCKRMHKKVPSPLRVYRKLNTTTHRFIIILLSVSFHHQSGCFFFYFCMFAFIFLHLALYMVVNSIVVLMYNKIYILLDRIPYNTYVIS